MLGSKKEKKMAMSPQIFRTLVYRIILPLVPKTRIEMSPIPTHCPSPECGTNSQWYALYILAF